jgi:hypothetical protein
MISPIGPVFMVCAPALIASAALAEAPGFAGRMPIIRGLSKGAGDPSEAGPDCFAANAPRNDGDKRFRTTR